VAGSGDIAGFRPRQLLIVIPPTGLIARASGCSLLDAVRVGPEQ